MTESVVKSKQTESNVLLKKTLGRAPSYQRKNFAHKNITVESGKDINFAKNSNDSSISSSPIARNSLPRTSYYSRLRNNRNEISSTSTTTESMEKTDPDKDISEKSVDTADMPLIFTLLKNPVNIDSTSETGQKNNKGEDKEMFIIAVTSKEAEENSIIKENKIINEVANMVDETENNPVYNTSPTTVKYHANYKDFDATRSDNNEQQFSSTIPPVKNIQTRKYARQRTKTLEQPEDLETPNHRHKGLRKFGDQFSKTTEASTNGVSK